MSSDQITDAQVLEFLAEQPDFFARHPEALTELAIPHSSDGAVSLVERQMTLLRERNATLRQRLTDITDLATDNDHRFNGTRALVFALIDSRPAQWQERIPQQMAKHFACDYAALHWFESPGATGCALVNEATKAALLKLLPHQQPLCSPLREHEMGAVFDSDRGAGSGALVPLIRDERCLGVVAVGSREPNHYRSGDGTLFLEFIAEVMVRLSTGPKQ